MKRNLNNVCITGSGNGIGKAISVLLNKHGYNVACVDINLEDAKNTINEFENKIAKSIAIYADISNVSHIKKMIKEGVDIIDLGAFSSRPGAKPFSLKEEVKRLFPALIKIRELFPDTIISIDTYRHKIAEQAIYYGANLINDIYIALRIPRKI